MLRTGTTLAGYRIDGVIGTGGMGVVYEATQLSLERTVALKLLAPHLSADPAFRERFRREAMLQAALEHPSIVTVYEAGESEDGLYIAMKLVRGTNLKQLALDGLTPDRALAILAQAASALDAAHDAGLIHRDVKPQNILVDDEDRAYLADFGLIKAAGQHGLTGSGQYLGSLDYVSPEQIRGEPVSVSSDLYAFAAVLYECLSGEVPFPCDTEAALLYAHLSEPPPRLTDRHADLPPALDAVIERGLAKQAAARYGSASGLVGAAESALTEVPPVVARPTRNGDARGRFSDTIVDPGVLRRAPVIALEPERRLPRKAIAALVVLALAAALAGFLLGRSRDRVEQPPSGVAVAGPLGFTFPSDDWAPAPRRPRIPGLSLADPVALVSRRADRQAQLLAGTDPRAEGPLLLSPAFLAELRRRPEPERVRLGSPEALRYDALRHRQLAEGLTLYAVPTTKGVATIACLAPAGAPADTGLADCEAVATTLALRGVKALPATGDPRYAKALDRTLKRLIASRERGRAQLRAAKTRAGQARAADRISKAFALAGREVLKLKPGPVERPDHRALVSALARASGAYRLLAVAARSASRPLFARASAAVRRAETTLGRELR